MKLCKCGQTIYDEPEQRSDKCYECTAKSFKTKAERNLFLGGNFYERRNMREKIWFIEQEVRIGNLSEYEATNQILNLISEEIEKVGVMGRYKYAQADADSDTIDTIDTLSSFGGLSDREDRLVRAARKAQLNKILNLLRPKENVVGTAEL